MGYKGDSRVTIYRLYKEGKDIILEIMHSIDNALHKLYNDNINRLESRWIYGKCIN